MSAHPPDVARVVLGGCYRTFFDDFAPGVRAELDTGVLAAAGSHSPLERDRSPAALITRDCLEPELLLALGANGDRWTIR
ncbi:hypothetical protein [Nocardia arthritidis]|uniref:Uncharacterized protein n=1 Tax=Nocardia arthritidis TaxID=228602 RepID=A0A6G9YH70_9NOCA|nr:hypothetical protein [Nocardia arthritidis]QIS12407.1 hypothetical protein F5544_22730 [Nocardia arthritidis]